MKRKIQREFVIVALISILLTTVLVTAVFYNLFCREIMNELRTYALMLQNEDTAYGQDMDYARLEAENLRITLIGDNGEVLFDNDAAVGQMDNHGSRPEV